MGTQEDVISRLMEDYLKRLILEIDLNKYIIKYDRFNPDNAGECNNEFTHIIITPRSSEYIRDLADTASSLAIRYYHIHFDSSHYLGTLLGIFVENTTFSIEFMDEIQKMIDERNKKEE